MSNVRWIYILFLVAVTSSKSIGSVNKAPAKVTLLIQFSGLGPNQLSGSVRLNLCVEKLTERCFWKLNEEIVWDGEQYKDKSFEFPIDDMTTMITLDVFIVNGTKKIYFTRTPINLIKFDSKRSFPIYSLKLDSLITVTVEHECENGYFPPRQCTKACFPMAGESECDGFGNKLCKEGLLYNAQVDRCISNNCNIKCQNGQCVKNDSSFKCICLEGYIGHACQTRSPCNPNPCLNGGKCIHNGNDQSFTCLCSPRFVTSNCGLKVPAKCPCPENMKCNYSDKGVLQSCTPTTLQNGNDDTYIARTNSQDSKLESGSLGSKKNNDWNQINNTTVLIAAVGCLVLILCLGASLYIYCRSRADNNDKRDYRVDNSPSTLYTDFTPKLNETSFERSFSLDDNFAYMSRNSPILRILPNGCTLGSSTGYSLNSNSYNDNPHGSIRNFPVQGNFISQQDYPITPMLLQQNYLRNIANSSTSTTSSSQMPPMLPPRNLNTDVLLPETITNTE